MQSSHIHTVVLKTLFYRSSSHSQIACSQSSALLWHAASPGFQSCPITVYHGTVQTFVVYVTGRASKLQFDFVVATEHSLVVQLRNLGPWTKCVHYRTVIACSFCSPVCQGCCQHVQFIYICITRIPDLVTGPQVVILEDLEFVGCPGWAAVNQV